MINLKIYSNFLLISIENLIRFRFFFFVLWFSLRKNTIFIDPLYLSFLEIEADTNTGRVLDVKFEETEDNRSWIEKLFTE